MDAITFTEYGDSSVMNITKQPMPTARPKDVIVRNKAIGVNPIDFKVRKGVLGAPISADNPLVVGWDAAGVVESVGDEVTSFKPGDEVYYAGDITRPGSYAQFTAVDSRAVALKPSSLDFVKAAAIPLVAETAWETIVEDFKAEEGQSILIYNGAGGVGSMAIQIAKVLGLKVIASASREESVDWCKSLGADYIVNHRCDKKTIQEQLKEHGFEKGVDFIFHLHEPENVAELVKCLKPLGQIALTWAASGEALAKLDSMTMFLKRQCIRYTLMFTRLAQDVKPCSQGTLLKRVAKLIDDGKVKDIVTKEFPWTEFAAAHELQESGSRCGKTVLKVE